jgi:hypothetical protein
MAVSPISCPWLLRAPLSLLDLLACPSDQALQISLRLQHRFQIGSQRRVLGCALLSSTTPFADPLSWLVECFGLSFSYPFTDRFSGDSCFAGYLADLSSANPSGLCRYLQPPLPLVEPSLHQLILLFL